MTCLRSSDDRWVCRLDAGEGQTNPSDRTLYVVTIDIQDGAIAEVSATLDSRRNPVPLASVVCPNLVCDVTTGFFSETIGLSPVAGSFGQAISKWVDANHRTGGQKSFGSMFVTLSPPGPVIAMQLSIGR